MTALRACQRYRADGTPCPNRTTNSDHWCREVDCPGYLRPSTAGAPDGSRTPRGTPNHIEMTRHIAVGLDVDEAYDVHLATRAVDSFRFHHGGSASAAQAELRSMLEDFLRTSAREVRRNGCVVLARSGYELVLSPDRCVVTGYATAHRERTWSQVKAGVRSRFRRERVGSEPREAVVEEGPPLPMDQVPLALDPATARLTGRVRTSYARLMDLRDASDEELDEHLRTSLKALAAGTVNHERPRPCVEVLADGLRWLLSDDGATVIGVARPRD